ncbi:hypothetical protein ROZALSC1DRAFT_29616 [Rozella allomycis CSF55]|uniref:Enhancer of rudimentary domain-containing protein n=1 Tax=Rozella allomycis (strain CSF55) TaxID=988480 RepID=A0A075B3C7_ROZAC|nr:Enhancer of rudimentary domain-containing protein [Rozella allomycis CSF55]RKP18715.1 hypothetical protein ROZALSC1DRAFT_29616 [Rozella allomycis CSF55]|eukprot:EPZ37050.1 Enhancer of rudimentary domain-containing protein [Rozella allomycis CSF55]
MYEYRLKDINPYVKNITYDVRDLHNYIDHLEECCALVFSQELKAYIPHDKEWIKAKVYNHLRKIANE